MDGFALVERIRAQFPALRREVAGRPAAFFDAPAGSQVPQPVIDAVADYLAFRNANTHGHFATSRETDELLECARDRMAALLGASSASEIAFGANMTTLTLALARALAREWGPGDEVIVTELDHQANVAPWRLAAGDAGATVHSVPFDVETGQLDVECLAGLLGPRTRLVAVGYASNALGTINDVRRVADLARAAGALSFVDAVHYAPHGVIDVREIGCDLLACSAYKFFGPHLGVLWGRPEVLEAHRPYKVPPASDRAPERWETGTLNHEGIAGGAAAVEWIASLARGADGQGWRRRVVEGMRVIGELEDALFRELWAGLKAIPGVRVHGPDLDAPRTPTVALTVGSRTPQEVAERLGAEGIFVWDGDFYASSVIDRLGLRESGGVVRVGLAPYNSRTEVEHLLGALEHLAR
ncbi:MAG TPA: cysteine desulfurase-like protein [Longimicrobiaceae bacterium]|nr:cysteine desulfurase-like protein [Longimicrobiaceae bacterium]